MRFHFLLLLLATLACQADGAGVEEEANLGYWHQARFISTPAAREGFVRMFHNAGMSMQSAVLNYLCRGVDMEVRAASPLDSLEPPLAGAAVRCHRSGSCA